MGNNRTLAASPIDILCRVVDNFGDIGVVWRLAKSLHTLSPQSEIRIIVDNLVPFAAIAPGLDPLLDVQTHAGFLIINENNPGDFLSVTPAKLCIEAFACGRATWYQHILYNPQNTEIRLHVILEYLSAEPYAAEYHKLPSLSPLSKVKKMFCMPGFEQGTAGLILDPTFLASRALWMQARNENRTAVRRRAFLDRWNLEANTPCDSFWLSIFSYEHNFDALVRDISKWATVNSQSVFALVAHGRGAAHFFDAWSRAGKPFPAVPMEFLPQEIWDDLILACDFNIVRGEESLARAVLSTRPFIWQAYEQDEGYQRVKVAALVDLMQKTTSFQSTDIETQNAWAAWKSLMTAFNEQASDTSTPTTDETFIEVLSGLQSLQVVFAEFAQSVEAVGDCTAGLLSLYAEMG